VKTWAPAEILSASDLNAEFNNILSNPITLISPINATLDLDGNELILDSDADTSIQADTDDQIDFKLGGTDIFKFLTVATAVNGLFFTGSATGDAVDITAFGSDTNVGIDITSKGNGAITLTTTGNIVFTPTDEAYSTTVSSNEIIKSRFFT